MDYEGVEGEEDEREIERPMKSIRKGIQARGGERG